MQAICLVVLGICSYHVMGIKPFKNYVQAFKGNFSSCVVFIENVDFICGQRWVCINDGYDLNMKVLA